MFLQGDLVKNIIVPKYCVLQSNDEITMLNLNTCGKIFNQSLLKSQGHLKVKVKQCQKFVSLSFV